MFIRPILWYGVEACYMTRTDVLHLKRIEGNLIKKIIGIPRWCKSTELHNALKIDLTVDRLGTTKTEFYVRLVQNDLTKKIMDYMEATECPNDYTSELYERVDIISMKLGTSAAEACEIYKKRMKLKMREAESPIVIELKKEIKVSNDGEKIKIITDLLRPQEKSKRGF
jgi:TusA-related sulfurtransferase